MIASPLRYSLLAGLVLAVMALVAAEGTGLRLGTALLLVPAAGGPVWVVLAYLAAVRRAHATAMLERPVWWSWTLANPLPAMALALGPAALAVWAVAVTLLTEGWAGLGWIAAAAGGLYPVAWLWSRRTGAFRPYARLRPVLRWAPVVTALLLTLAWVALRGLSPAGEGSWAERVAAEPRFEGGRALFGWIVESMAILDGSRGFAEAWAEGWGAGAVVTLWRVGVVFGQFWLLAGLFAAGLIPAGEPRRILAPSDADAPPRPGPGRVALAAAVAVLLGWALVHLAVAADARAEALQARTLAGEAPRLAAPGLDGAGPVLPAASAPPLWRAPPPLTPAALREAIETEALGEWLCAPGTLAAVEALDARMARLLAGQEAAVRQGVHRGFDMMRGNVDAYLDWHYTLTAQYLQTYLALIDGGQEFLEGEADAEVEGSFARDLETRFAEHLGRGEPFARLDAELRDILRENPGRLAGYGAERDRLLASCGLALPSDAGERVVVLARAEGLTQSGPVRDALAFEERLSVSGLAAPTGAVAGMILGKTMAAKIAASAGFKAVSAAVAKFLVAKSGGWLAGAAAGGGTGALLCSWVPGIGTATCALVGGIAGGLAVGVTIDKLALEVEEAVWRDEHRAEILGAIDAAEAEVLAGLFPVENDPPR